MVPYFFFQTQKLVEEEDIEAARIEFKTSFYCRALAWMWGATVAPLLLTVGAMFIALRAEGVV